MNNNQTSPASAFSIFLTGDFSRSLVAGFSLVFLTTPQLPYQFYMFSCDFLAETLLDFIV